MKAVIYPNFQKNNALECAKELCGILKANNIEVFMDDSFRTEFSDRDYIKYDSFEKVATQSDFVIAIGGDGTILRCAKKIIGSDTPLIGINSGRLGFMSTLEYDQLEQIKNLKTGNYTISQRMMLHAEIDNGEGERVSFESLNDISVLSEYAGICDFEIFADDSMIGKYRADGAIFSTPTGSTAYSLSAGGPIIEPDMRCIEMTLICPHSLFTRPMIFSPERRLKFENRGGRNPDMFVSVDGGKPIKLNIGSRLEITSSKHTVKIVDMAQGSFFNSLNKKFMHPIK